MIAVIGECSISVSLADNNFSLHYRILPTRIKLLISKSMKMMKNGLRARASLLGGLFLIYQLYNTS